MISIDDFLKLEIKVGTVLTAQKIKGSEKLVKLEVDLGNEKRQIVAGIGKSYEPEQLLGKQVCVLVNLEPRNLMGLESQGMLLAAGGDDGKPVLLVPEHELPSGSRVR